MNQPDMLTNMIGTCWSCCAVECWKPRQPKLNPREGCAEWLPANPQPAVEAEPIEVDDE